MSIYNDMANDAGYSYETAENYQMAEMIERDRGNAAREQAREEEEEMMREEEQSHE